MRESRHFEKTYRRLPLIVQPTWIIRTVAAETYVLLGQFPGRGPFPARGLLLVRLLNQLPTSCSRPCKLPAVAIWHAS